MFSKDGETFVIPTKLLDDLIEDPLAGIAVTHLVLHIYAEMDLEGAGRIYRKLWETTRATRINEEELLQAIRYAHDRGYFKRTPRESDEGGFWYEAGPTYV